VIVEPAQPFLLGFVFSDRATFGIDVAKAAPGCETRERAIVWVGFRLEHDVEGRLLEDVEIPGIGAEEEMAGPSGCLIEV
jgi:hypothetical protein